ncbi:hypothetical protein RFM68_11520 [Mesorhizobium sp. MSK_1335]|uniref:Uncharacterized protein n=1 Tax=Mesorhizobium montanum TaxID=3072323 RepID=A0ABU4ZIE4_9HYPH|nr:hypothetical protein [Mesorhizobium sp. MSK_1335]MDX8525139.1 hypothetical protein [Mesorhizobium sp. MSK_1335]
MPTRIARSEDCQPVTSINDLLLEDAGWFARNRHLPFRYRVIDRKTFLDGLTASAGERGFSSSAPHGGASSVSERLLIVTLLTESPDRSGMAVPTMMVFPDPTEQHVDRARQGDIDLGFELLLDGARQKDATMIDMLRRLVIRAEVKVPAEWDIWGVASHAVVML